MSTTITTPKNVVPVGQVTIGGTTYDVKQHPEFVRFFFDLFRRIGGNVSLTNAELEEQITLESLAPKADVQVMPDFREYMTQPPRIDALPPADMSSGRLEALEAEVARMGRLINDLQSGYHL